MAKNAAACVGKDCRVLIELGEQSLESVRASLLGMATSRPPRLLRFQPLFKRQHDAVLIFFRAANEESGEYRAGKYRQGLARVRQNILLTPQLIDGQRVAVVAPDFRNPEGCIDWKLGD